MNTSKPEHTRKGALLQRRARKQSRQHGRGKATDRSLTAPLRMPRLRRPAHQCSSRQWTADGRAFRRPGPMWLPNASAIAASTSSPTTARHGSRRPSFCRAVGCDSRLRLSHTRLRLLLLTHNSHGKSAKIPTCYFQNSRLSVAVPIITAVSAQFITTKSAKDEHWHWQQRLSCHSGRLAWCLAHIHAPAHDAWWCFQVIVGSFPLPDSSMTGRAFGAIPR